MFRGIAAVYLLAFLSLWFQLDGLIGSSGIEPATGYLEAVREHYGDEAPWRAPTLLWLGASDTALHFVAGLGCLGAVLVVCGVAPGPLLLLVWAFYLSLANVSGIFLSYQWDALLLEAGLLGVFFAPWRRYVPFGSGGPAPLAITWLLRLLVFKLMLLSGLVKLASGDPTWRDLTAMQYHHFTTPLPAFTSWYAHHLPDAFHSFEAGMTFVIEIGGALLILGPRVLRLATCAALVGLQLMIGATGNYGFFNLLTVVLCLSLLDDGALRWIAARARLPLRFPAPEPRPRGRVARAGFALVLVGIGLMSCHVSGRRLGVVPALPDPVHAFAVQLGRLRSINSYGLFAVMTTKRDEIILEGSRDGREWQTYAFRWKPGALDRAPGFAGPHMPRVDWQMWFASLGSCERNPWFVRFMTRLLEGAPEVTALLAHDPFPDEPPRYLRSTRWSYRFTDPGTPEAERDWWQRERVGPYCVPITLQGGRPARASVGD